MNSKAIPTIQSVGVRENRRNGGSGWDTMPLYGDATGPACDTSEPGAQGSTSPWHACPFGRWRRTAQRIPVSTEITTFGYTPGSTTTVCGFANGGDESARIVST